MRKTVSLLSTLLLLAVVATTAGAAEEEGFKPIFNGKNLDGWVIQGLEKAGPKLHPDDGILEVGGWDYWALITKKKYGDYILRFDCKFEKKGNSGIIVHTYSTKEAFKKEAFEIQLNADAGEVEKKCTGTLFTPKGSFQEPKANPTKAIGEWNSVEVKFADKKLSLTINGTPVYENLDMTQFDVVKLQDEGHIAIQRNDYKKAVFFKNIRVKELE